MQTTTRNKGRRGVSEVVSAILLLAIAVAIGSILYVQTYLTAAQQQAQMVREAVKSDMAVKQQLRILLVVGNSSNNKVKIVVAASSYPVQLHSIYVNNTLAASYRDYSVQALTLEVVEVDSPVILTKRSKILVKVVHGGGVEEAYGDVH